MNNNTGIVFLALFGLIAVAGVAIVVASRRDQPTESGQFVYGVPVEPQTALAVPVLYENKEEWEIVRGPDRLIEKVVIHRMVTQKLGSIPLQWSRLLLTFRHCICHSNSPDSQDA
ncbi:unnamed protein product [marine sediment metagenome]|uniref:Uncharacterized protein n=1 Tax=marine sediment metagenome TaxID=412755 RepID=X1UJA2_9ZZZZ